ncbi:MAG: hypothetical protein WDN69_26170 [Aliidongia sp.]
MISRSNLATRIGYDLDRGRLDPTVHPFEISFTRDDVRITTRYPRNFLPASVFGTLHETGHALYEQASIRPIAAARWRLISAISTPSAASASAPMNRNPACGKTISAAAAPSGRCITAPCATAFPSNWRKSTDETFHRAVNRVSPA